MSESIMVEMAFKCDLCGELFNSPDDAQNHNQKTHTESVPKDELRSWVVGTSTPAEDREQERAEVKSQLDRELQEWEVESTKDGQEFSR